MECGRRHRRVGSIALGSLLSVWLLGAGAASATSVPAAASNPHVSGTVTDSATGKPIAGIEVTRGFRGGDAEATTTTGSDGKYSLELQPSTPRTVWFTDPGRTYLWGCYINVWPNHLRIGWQTVGSETCGEVSLATDMDGLDVEMTAGLHIKGAVTGPGGVPLGGIHVYARSSTARAWGDGRYDDSTSTGADGAYSLTVLGLRDDGRGPVNSEYRVRYRDDQRLFDICDFDWGRSSDCVTVRSVRLNDRTGLDVEMHLREGVTLSVNPADATIQTGSSQAYTAKLVAPTIGGVVAHPAASEGGIDVSNVTAQSTFVITGSGSCSGASCRPSVDGDYTVTANYGGLQGEATLHARPHAGPARRATLPPTGTNDSGDSRQSNGPLSTALLLGLSTVAGLSMILRLRTIRKG